MIDCLTVRWTNKPTYGSLKDFLGLNIPPQLGNLNFPTGGGNLRLFIATNKLLYDAIATWLDSLKLAWVLGLSLAKLVYILNFAEFVYLFVFVKLWDPWFDDKKLEKLNSSDYYIEILLQPHQSFTNGYRIDCAFCLWAFDHSF